MIRSEFRSAVAKLGVNTKDDVLYEEKCKSWKIHNSLTIDEDTFVTIHEKELDNNGDRQVVIKLMKRRDQFERECKSRDENELDPRYVVGIFNILDETNPRLIKDLEQVSKMFADHNHTSL